MSAHLAQRPPERLAPDRRVGVCLAGALMVAVTACGGDGQTEPVTRATEVEVLAGAGQIGLHGVPLPDSLVAVFRGSDGPVAGLSVTWTVLGGGSLDVARSRTDARGRAAALFTPGRGPDSVRVEGDGLEVIVRARGDSADAGTVHIGRNAYVDYEAGDLPIIVSAGHGGRLEPGEIPDRTFGVVGSDRNTDQVAEALADAIEARMGGRPHLVISRLHRRKLDPNREIVEAAQGNPRAKHAWLEYHTLLEHASERVAARHGRGLYLDLHGHGHPIQRLELGYLLSATDLARTDAELDGGSWAASSSIRTLAAEAGVPFSVVLRGPESFGGLMEDAGYAATPSDIQPDPGPNPFFSGGYNTRRHGSLSGGPISGIQIEAQYTGLRDTSASRAAYAAALAASIEAYLDRWYAELDGNR